MSDTSQESSKRQRATSLTEGGASVLREIREKLVARGLGALPPDVANAIASRVIADGRISDALVVETALAILLHAMREHEHGRGAP